jgi:uncharacterized protein involved in response to NO
VAATFPLLFAAAGAKRFSAVKRRRNHVFPAILLMLAVTTLLLFGASLVPDSTLTRAGLILTLYLIVLLIIVMGGRLIPAVTIGALRGQSHLSAIHAQHGRELACIVAMAVFMVFETTPLPDEGSGLAAWLLATILVLRMKDWGSLEVWRLPEIWPLHMGYAWIIIGLVLLGFVRFGIINGEAEALHALGVGGIGTITLAMMARLIRLHAAGKQAPAWLGYAHRFFIVAVLLRVSGPWFVPREAATILWLSALAWSLSYTVLLAFFVTTAGDDRR